MNEKEKLIELIQNAVNGCARYWAECIADHLLANGVILPPCKVGDKIYWFGMFNQIVEGEVVRTEAYIGAKTAITDGYVFDLESSELGKTVFLSREEAEKDLKGVE